MAERGAPIGNPAPFAARMIAEGINATEGLRMLRDSGAGVETQRWYRVYGEMQAAIQARPEIQALDFTQAPQGQVWTEWQTRGTGYAYQVTHAVWDPELGVRSTRQATVISAEPISIQDALDQANEEFTENTGVTGTNPVVWLGSTVTGLHQMTGTL